MLLFDIFEVSIDKHRFSYSFKRVKNTAIIQYRDCYDYIHHCTLLYGQKVAIALGA